MTRVGILGGGQLGKMLLQAASPFPIIPYVLDQSEDVPCYSFCKNFTLGSVSCEETVYQFGKQLDVLTIEFEHVNTDALFRLEKEGVKVFPQPHLIQMIQDKGLQKEFWKKNGIPTSEYKLVSQAEEMNAYPDFFPVVQKTRRGGYDGKGVKKLKSIEMLTQALPGLSVMEKEVPIAYELSVIVARNPQGQTMVYEPVLMEFDKTANLLDVLICPAPLEPEIVAQTKKIALDVVNALGIIGVLAVECFVTHSGDVLVNEVAPRPHNSGHHTIEACVTSQYAQHLRAILGMPLGSVDMHSPSAVMVNLLGPEGIKGPYKLENLEPIMEMPGVFFHWYGKCCTSPFRKLGHVTVIESTISLALDKAKQAKNQVRITS